MSRFLPAVLLVAAFAAAGRAASPYDDLLKAVPPNTNTLVLVDVKGAFASPLAQKEQWSGDHFQRYQSGIGFVPPDAELLVVASDLNLSSLARSYQIGLVKVRNVPNLNQLAVRENGTEDELSGRIVVLSPQDVYYTTLPGSTFAAVYPADRQAASRWVRHALASKSAELAPYLKSAADSAGAHTMVIAIDLTDAIDPTMLRAGLAISPSVVKNKVADIAVLARVAATVKGMTFTVNVTDKIVGTVRIDLAADPSPFKKTFRDLFLEILDDQGVSIPGMSEWETTYGPTSMTLSGPLTTADVRRITSLFAFPGSSPEGDPKATKEPTGPATQRYLAAVDRILGDARGIKDSPQIEKMATWNEKAALRIEQLSRQSVDPAAIDAALQSARRLRAIAQSLRGVPIEWEALQNKAYSYSTSQVGASFGWGGIRPVWMSGTTHTNYPQIRAEQSKVIAADQQRRLEAWSQIDSMLGEAKGKLSQKYKVKF